MSKRLKTKSKPGPRSKSKQKQQAKPQSEPRPKRKSGKAPASSGTDERGRAVPAVGSSYEGVFQGIARGGGFVVLDAPGFADVFVPWDEADTALHGDQVRVRVHRKPAGRAPVGEIERVHKHANKRILGQITRSRRISVVKPKNPKLTRPIEVPRQFKQEEIPDGAWVIVEVVHWAQSPDAPLSGKVIEVLGLEGDKRLPILLLIRGEGVVPEFTDEIEAEARAAAEERISEVGIAARRDLRGERIFTIDPATAKDFDDAISLVEKRGDSWRVGVHIADVSHYVRPGTPLDAEAYDRATSVYPVDRVVPMLPEVLSNGACSLRPGEDKFAMTVYFDVTSEGDIGAVELFSSVIHSVKRFAYEDVQAVFDKADGVQPKIRVPKIPAAVWEDLGELRRAGACLRKERERRGALELDLPETEVVFDEAGLVSNLKRKERFESHRMIEDFMIAANEAVGRALTRAKLPMLYRVHDSPDPAKVEALRPAFARFGISLPKGAVGQSHLQAALHKALMHPAGSVIQRWVLRALPRAQYQPVNLGHFGLASSCYAHFTSPIRRYPDLIVHRAVKALIAGEEAREEFRSSSAAQMAEWGRHCSAREQRSQKIEWDAEKILVLEFMKQFLGDIFEGFISGAMQKGFFVELKEYPAEGFVPVRALEDDFYTLDDAGLSFHGRRTGRTFSVGDAVKVLIERVDPMAGQMDFFLVRREGGAGASPHAGAKKHKKGHGRKGQYPWHQHVRKTKRRG